MLGVSTEEDRSHLIMCTCLTNLKKGSKKSFIMALSKDPNCPCVLSCPFGIIYRYNNVGYIVYILKASIIV